MKNKILCSCLGGSRAYGLNTPTSDYDERSVFMHTDLDYIFNLKQNDTLVNQNSSQDVVSYELRRFFELLAKTNTSVIEILFSPKFIEADDFFLNNIILNKLQFVDTEYLYKSIRGYIQNEKRLMNGERTGQLGSKRKQALETYGYSYKNYVQIVRLGFCARHFIRNQDFPIYLPDFNPDLAEFLLKVKKNPNIVNVQMANAHVDLIDKNIEHAFLDRDKSKDLKFNKELANQFVKELYLREIRSI